MSDYTLMPPFDYREADPAFQHFSARLHVETDIDDLELQIWVRLNLQRLMREFKASGEPTPQGIWIAFDGWARLEYLRAQREGVL